MVGHAEYALTPSRIAGYSSTLTELKSTPTALRIRTAWPEKPHCGADGVPFMYSITSLSLTCASMSFITSSAPVGTSFFLGLKSSWLSAENRRRPVDAIDTTAAADDDDVTDGNVAAVNRRATNESILEWGWKSEARTTAGLFLVGSL